MKPPQAIYPDRKTQEQLLLLKNHAESVVTIPEPSRRHRKRWIGVLFLHACLCFLVVNSFLLERVKGFFMFQSVTNNEVISSPDWSIPSNITLGECAQWNENVIPPSGDLIAAVATFGLPLSSNTLLFLSRGAAGGINVQYGGERSDVQVTVQASYRFPEALHTVDVCIVTRGEGENGVGIFGLPWSHPRHQRNFLRFTVMVTLPQQAKGSVLNIKALETDMPLFTHEIADLNGSVHFNSISLKTANSPIHVQSLEAEKTSIMTANSPIEGEFHGSSSLKLHTSNSPVNAYVTLFSADGDDYTDLDISTSNSAIRGTLSLESANESGGKFKVHTSTSNSPLELFFVESPVDSILMLDATTSIGPATVSLHPAYEGRYTAVTSFQRPSILVNHDVEDPAGRGRKRQVRSLANRGPFASGTVRWYDGDDNKKLIGNVEVHTSFSPLTLRI
ncbi:hypothetical protein C0992_007843 [Termitomyces sp. T32_za158]|nr:hypothetical protein C0992_007843 [Termitomyces sp. T32_za158]